MSVPAARADDARSQALTIGDISELVAVPIPTLRSWERRYRIPPRTRPDGTTRRYNSVEVQMLTLLRDDIARGVRAAEAADSLRSLFDDQRAGAPFVSGLLDASARPDPAGIGDWLDRASAELGLGACLDEVLLPALRWIGSSGQTQHGDAGDESATIDAVCRWLRQRAAALALPAGAPLVLLATDDQHDIAPQSLAVLLRERQLRCSGLPRGLSSAGLGEVLRASRPAAVVLLSQLPSTRRLAVTRLRALRDSGAEVCYAGNAFAAARSRRGVPGRYLGLSLRQAADTIGTSVRAARSRGSR